MIGDYDIQDAEERKMVSDTQIPAYESEFMNAKMFLQLASTNTGDNLYDHLCETLNKILAERPLNVIDFFEEYSRRIKEKRYKPQTDHLEDIYIPPSSFALANTIIPMLKPLPPGEPSTVDPADLEVADMSQNNMLQLLYYFEHCGLGLPRPEMFYIMLSMRKLIYKEPISSIRFWGRIFGTLKNYNIVECELKNEEYIKRNETYQLLQLDEVKHHDEENEELLEENRIRKALDEIARVQQFGGEGSKYPRQLPPEPKSLYEELPEPPSEPSGVGLNRMVYYVSTGIEEPWCQLPDVTPKQIRTCRQVYKSFTGNLEEPVLTYPEFPGKEKEYLRAQIARITSGTQISPLGYFTFGEEELGEGAGDEEAEEEAEEVPEPSKTAFIKNSKYEPPPLKDLLDPSMSFWVHHTPFILPQGRTTWWNPYPLPEGLGEGADEESKLGEAEEEEVDDYDLKKGRLSIEPETGPPLLTPLSEDAAVEAVPPWSVRCSSNIMDDFAIAVVRSNLWPGAYCFSTQGKLFQNIYLGFGLKYMEHNFSPMPLPPVQQEYPTGAEIMEIADPTGAEEEKWRVDHLPKPQEELPVIGEELGEGEEEEEEEMEYDD
ncbi:unnamed protein product [Psylliodes chrysocephalus]|uniref:Radial spokehead-like protein n=1 Tax=Psylliodes chrysocephalus TaxID=3402493 RepID=A0A9P0D9N9_9CUCU|nr:unnamed protein product [Psylliodes chrysocephala]